MLIYLRININFDFYICFDIDVGFDFSSRHILHSEHLLFMLIYLRMIINVNSLFIKLYLSAGTSYIVSIVAKNTNGDSEAVVLTVTTR